MSRRVWSWALASFGLLLLAALMTCFAAWRASAGEWPEFVLDSLAAGYAAHKSAEFLTAVSRARAIK